jgi:hypothetical protein
MTPYAGIVLGMSQTMKQLTTGWRMRTGIVMVGAAVALAATLGPESTVTARLGASEVADHATVTAADTITSTDVLAGVAAAAGVRRRGLDGASRAL